MLISRTYRTYYQDYPYLEGIVSVSVTDYPPSSSCPNDLSALTTSLVNGVNISEDRSIAVRVNGDLTTRYIPTYYGDTVGKPFDDANGLWGSYNSVDISEYGFVGILMGGVQYYLPVYNGAYSSTCSTNIIGDFYTTGNFTESGLVLLKINNVNLRYAMVYSKI